MTRSKKILAATATGIAAAGSAGAVSALAGGQAATRADCPGMIACPITGELVCIDRCPIETDAAAVPLAEVPGTCCSGDI